MRLFARYFNRNGGKRHDAGNDDEAIRYYRKAIAADPEWSAPWFNLGLVHKYRSEWSESYCCNAEAMRLDPQDEATIWNIGIAATALENWQAARKAWKAYGMDIAEGTEPVEMDLGSVPIRINPDDNGEVVWCLRICPARAVIVSVPLPESGYASGDLLLHDGAPVGYRMRGNDEVPVFNALGILKRSPNSTFGVDVEVQGSEDLECFKRECIAAGCSAEDWSTLRVVCRACSESRPHDHDAKSAEPSIKGTHHFGVSAPSREIVEQAISAWLSIRPGCTADDIELLASPSDRLSES